MRQHYSQPIESVSMGKAVFQERGHAPSWFWVIWLYLGLVVVGIFTMIFRMTLSLM